MSNYFRAKVGLPYHLSVGAVILKDQRVLCHYYPEFELEVQRYDDFYILMRETVEPNEALEAALKRGCLEEMGATVEIEDFIGPIVAHFQSESQTIEKTTLYFKCKLIDQDDAKRDPEDPEKDSRIILKEIDFLIEKMKEQGQRLGREDLDESAVLERLL